MNEETNTVIVLTTREINTAESADDLERRLSRGSASPFQMVEDTDGKRHWLNVAYIVEIHDPPDPSSVHVGGS